MPPVHAASRYANTLSELAIKAGGRTDRRAFHPRQKRDSYTRRGADGTPADRAAYGIKPIPSSPRRGNAAMSQNSARSRRSSGHGRR